MAGIYIHVPFCGSRCIYCDFFSTTMLERRQEYVDALCRELKARRTDETISTVYLGGGTPSMLERRQLDQILDAVFANYDIDKDAEITIEANPDDVTHTLLHGLPINRLSMGVQSFNDDSLRFLRRRHNCRQVTDALGTARRCGISNISIDLIYGLPGQGMDEWRNDVETAISLDVQHLSAYALSYEEGTLLYKEREAGRVKEASDEMSRAMYFHLCDATEKAGFRHYEISNFARSGMESRHNSSYWTGVPYLGFGPAAHSYDGHRLRRGNAASMDMWMQGECNEEHLDTTDLFNERIFLSLRTAQGLDIEALKRDFPALYESMLPHLRRHIGQGNLTERPPFVRLSREALFVSDSIISDLFAD